MDPGDVSKRVEQYGELRLGGDEGQAVDLAGVTALLGVAPTVTYAQGQELRGGRRRRRALWVWKTPEEATYDSEATLRAVLDQFMPVREAIHEACRQFGLWGQIGLVVSMYGDLEDDAEGAGANVSTPALGFSVETLRDLAALGLPFDCDQYVIVPDPAE